MAFSFEGISDGEAGCIGPLCADFIPQQHEVPFVRLTTEEGLANFRQETRELGGIIGGTASDLAGGAVGGIFQNPVGGITILGVFAAAIAGVILLK